MTVEVAREYTHRVCTPARAHHASDRRRTTDDDVDERARGRRRVDDDDDDDDDDDVTTRRHTTRDVAHRHTRVIPHTTVRRTARLVID